MLDMSSKATAILNDKFKIKWFLFLSLNLEVESQLSEFIFSSQSINIEPSSLSNPTWTHVAISMLRGEQVHSSQFSKNKQTLPRQPMGCKSVTTKGFKGLQAQSSVCTSANPLPSKLEDGFPVFKRIQSSCGFQVQQLQDTNARANTHIHIHTQCPQKNIKVSAKLYSWEQGFGKLPDFLSLYTETSVIQLPMDRILTQLRFL